MQGLLTALIGWRPQDPSSPLKIEIEGSQNISEESIQCVMTWKVPMCNSRNEWRRCFLKARELQQENRTEWESEFQEVLQPVSGYLHLADLCCKVQLWLFLLYRSWKPLHLNLMLGVSSEFQEQPVSLLNLHLMLHNSLFACTACPVKTRGLHFIRQLLNLVTVKI